jgi:hypothetical protein
VCPNGAHSKKFRNQRILPEGSILSKTRFVGALAIDYVTTFMVHHETTNHHIQKMLFRMQTILENATWCLQ